jgi:hypothetical protein
MSTSQRPQKPRTAAQRASDANRVEQMAVNVRLGRATPAPRERVVSSAAYEERFKTSPHRR